MIPPDNKIHFDDISNAIKVLAQTTGPGQCGICQDAIDRLLAVCFEDAKTPEQKAEVIAAFALGVLSERFSTRAWIGSTN